MGNLHDLLDSIANKTVTTPNVFNPTAEIFDMINKNVVFTGTLKVWGRKQAIEILQNTFNVKVQSAVTSTTDALIVADSANNTTKLQAVKKKNRNVRIITETEFNAIMDGID